MASDKFDHLPPLIDLVTAAGILGIGRTLAYELVRRGEWPTPVLRMGRLIKVPTRPLLVLVGIDDAQLASSRQSALPGLLDPLVGVEDRRSPVGSTR